MYQVQQKYPNTVKSRVAGIISLSVAFQMVKDLFNSLTALRNDDRAHAFVVTSNQMILHEVELCWVVPSFCPEICLGCARKLSRNDVRPLRDMEIQKNGYEGRLKTKYRFDQDLPTSHLQ